MGDHAVGRLLVLTQVVLGMQLPFAIYPLIRLTSERRAMGPFANSAGMKAIAWSLFAFITAVNLWLFVQTFTST
jgi:manganese transport protein